MKGDEVRILKQVESVLSEAGGSNGNWLESIKKDFPRTSWCEAVISETFIRAENSILPLSNALSAGYKRLHRAI